jgi:hypothetical protein
MKLAAHHEAGCLGRVAKQSIQERTHDPHDLRGIKLTECRVQPADQFGERKAFDVPNGQGVKVEHRALDERRT